MSTTIDQRVAELRFDNSHFEKNVATSMSTLDKLKQKLNLTGASKGLENLGSAAKKVDMTPLGKGIDVVQSKFSALSSMKDQFFRNIENNIERTAKNFARMFTIDPVKTGFNEYELKMGSIQTIMASTGESLEKVNGYLNELNEYSDKTIYSFSDMTQNIGKFTNAGVKLQDAVAAIQGISNEAALSGANANEASRAMYNFAQALSAGYVKLIDWKSIENANMATVGFKEELIATAVEMGTLTKTTEGYETAEGKVITATKNFNDSLQDQWMTSDVLITTLKRYSDETTDIGKKATQAATEVKTFSQMMDSLKESAQSGWAQTWEIIFGDFNEGKALWTSIYNVASKVLDKMADARNSVLKGVFNSKWDQLVEKVNKAGISTEKFSDTVKEMAKEAGIPIDDLIEEFGSLEKVIKKGKIPAEIFKKAIKKLIGAEDELTESTEAVTKTVEDLDEIVKKVMRGDFGNGEERIKKLAEAGYDYATVQNKVNEILGVSTRHTSSLTEEQKKQVSQLSKLTDEQLKNKGYTDEQIEALRELEKAAEGAGGSLDELIASMEKPSGRELLIDSFKNLGETAKEIFKIIGDAWKNIFGTSTETEKSQSLYNLIEKFHDLTESMTMSEDEAKKFGHIMEGVFSAIEISWSVASMSVVGVVKIIAAVLELFGTDLLTVLEWVALKIKDLNEWIDDLAFFGAESKWTDFAKVITAILTGLKNCLEALFSLEKFSGVAKKFKEVIADIFDFDTDVNFLSIEFILEKINGFFGKIESWIKGVDSAENVGVYIVQGLAKGLWSGIKFVGEAILGVGKAVLDIICGFLGIHSPSTKFMEIGQHCIDGLILGFKKGYAAVKTVISDFIKGCISVIQKVDWGKVLSIGLSVGLIVTMKKLSDTLQTVISPFKAVGDGIGHLLTSIGDGLEAKFKAQALQKKAGAILKIAVAIGILVAAIVVLTKIPVGTLWATIGALAALAGIIIGLSIACEKLNKIGDFGLKSASLLAIGGTILMLAGTLKVLSTIDVDDMPKTMLMLAGIIVALGVLLVAIGKLAEGSDLANIHKVGSMIKKIAWALLLMVGVIKLASLLDESTVKRGVGVIALVSLLFAGIIAVTKVVGETDAKKVGQMMTRMSFALLLMVGVIKLASMLSNREVGRGIGVIAAVGILFAVFIKVSEYAGEHASKAGTMLLKISTALLIMIGVVKLAAGLSNTEILKGLAVVTGFGLIIKALIKVSEKAGKEASGAGNMLLKAAVAMLIMTAVLIILKELDPEGIGKAMGIIAGLSAIFAGLIYVTKYAKDADKVKGTLITLTIAVGVLSLALIALSFLDPKKVATAGAALSSVVGVFALLVKMTEHLKSGKKTWKRNLATILTLTLVVAALGEVIHRLSTIEDPNAAIIAAGALSILLLSLATSMEIISKSKAFTKGKLTQILAALGVLSGVMIILASVLWAMSTLNVQNVIPNAIALSGMVLVLSMVVQNLSTLDGRKTKGLTRAVGCMVILSLVMGVLGGVLAMMSSLDTANAIPNAIALSVLIGVLTGVMAALSLIVTQNNTKDILLGVVGLAALCVPLAALAFVLASMSDTKNATTNAMALSVLAGVLTLLLIPLGIVGMMYSATGGLAATGILGLLAMCVPLLSLVEILKKMEDLNGVMENAKALALLVGALGVVTFLLGLVGPAAIIGVGAMTSLTLLITAIGVLAVAIGALMKEFPALEEFLDKGINVLVRLANGLGEMIGAFIGGVAEGITSSLPAIGLALSMFMTNAMGFINGAKLVDESVATGAGILIGAILLLTAADFIEGVVRLLNGGTSFATLGLELSAFMYNAMGFITGARMITPEMVESVKLLAEAILIITGAGLLEGITRLLGGGSSMETFGSQLGFLGQGLNSFITALGPITEEQVTAAKNAAAIIKTLAQASAEIPNTGGLLGELVGENEMGPWAAQLPILASGICSFAKTISEAELSDEQVEIAKKAAQIIKVLAKAAAESPNAGGLLADLIGDNDFETWGNQLPKVASGIAGFCKTMADSGMSEDQVEIAKKAASIIKILAKAADEIPNTGGLLASIVGDNSFESFAAQLPNLGKGVAGFADELGTFDESKLATVTAATKAIKVIANMSKDYDALGDCADFTSFGDGMINLAKKVKKFIDKMSEISGDNVTSAVKKIKEVIKLAQTVADTEIESLKTFGNSLKKIGTDGIKELVDAFTNEDHKKKIKEGAKAMMDAFVKGLEDKKESVGKKAKSVASSAANKMKSEEITAKAKSAGKALVNGFAEGISEQTFKAEAKARAMANAAEKAAKEALDINSPSKVFRAIGYSVPEGFAMGIDRLGGMVTGSVSTMANNAIGGVKSAIAKVSELVNTDIDSQPTIRPVLDLSEVQSGAGLLSGMFDTTANVGVMSNVRSISSMMNNRQNGNNDDVVSALKDLRQSLGNGGGTTYNINGVTYDGSSGVAEAIETITRAARIERRI